MAAGAHGADVEHAGPRRRRTAGTSSSLLTARERVRAVPAHEVRRPEALLARRRRVADPAAATSSIEAGGDGGRREIVMGMPHRGRLNVLAQHPAQALRDDLRRVRGHLPADRRPGRRRRQVPPRLLARPHDPHRAQRARVAAASTRATSKRSTRLSKASVRAKQELPAATASADRVVPVLMHGDAAFTGQGIVIETLGAVRAGRASAPAARSTSSSTTRSASPRRRRTTASRATRREVAKVIQAPVFHVNGDDPEAAVQAARLAARVPQHASTRTCIIDLVCYRRHGHNELDDPTFTQPRHVRARSPRTPPVRAAVRRAPRARGRARRPTRRRRQTTEFARPVRRCPRTTRATSCRGSRCSPSAASWKGMAWAGDDWSAQTAVPARDAARDRAAASATCPTASRASQGAAPVCRARRRCSSRRRRHRLGLRRDARVRHAAARGHQRAPERPGQRARHLQPPPRRAARHGDRRALRAARPHLAPTQGRFQVIDSMLSEAACSASSTASASPTRATS